MEFQPGVETQHQDPHEFVEERGSPIMPEEGSSTSYLATAAMIAGVGPGDASGPCSSELPFNIVTAQVRNGESGGIRDMA